MIAVPYPSRDESQTSKSRNPIFTLELTERYAVTLCTTVTA